MTIEEAVAENLNPDFLTDELPEDLDSKPRPSATVFEEESGWVYTQSEHFWSMDKQRLYSPSLNFQLKYLPISLTLILPEPTLDQPFNHVLASKFPSGYRLIQSTYTKKNGHDPKEIVADLLRLYDHAFTLGYYPEWKRLDTQFWYTLPGQKSTVTVEQIFSKKLKAEYLIDPAISNDLHP